MVNLMLVCPELNECEHGSQEDKCCFFDQKTKGAVFNDFGKLLAGYEGETIDPKVIDHVKHALEVLPAHEDAKPKEIIRWLQEHEGHRIRIENWCAPS